MGGHSGGADMGGHHGGIMHQFAGAPFGTCPREDEDEEEH